MLLSCVLALCVSAHAQLKPGDSFPPFSDGKLVGTVPATAGKVMLVDFWASWCAPCKESFPVYAAFQADYGARGLVVVAVSEDVDAAACLAFVRKYSPPFATVRDQGQKLVSEIKIPIMPTCYLVDRSGKVRYVHGGFYGADTEDAIRTEIQSLLAESAPP